MRMNLKQYVGIAVMTLAIGVTGTVVRGAASPSPQDHHDMDYSKNKNYQKGMHDGRDDMSHNRDHYKKRHFKKDDDQKAYEAGYQEGHRDNRPDHK